MEVPTLKAESRKTTGTRRMRQLRTEGRLPCIIYGHGETPEPISVSAHDVMLELKHGARVVELEMGGATSQYLIKEIQYDHLDKDPIHIDFKRVNMDERIQVKVAIELRGTPEGIHEGGILDQLRDSMNVECLAAEIPDTLHPNVAHLNVGESLVVKDIELPSGVTALDDPEEKIALVHLLSTKQAAEDEEESEEGADEAAQPERIGRVAETDESKSNEKS